MSEEPEPQEDETTEEERMEAAHLLATEEAEVAPSQEEVDEMFKPVQSPPQDAQVVESTWVVDDDGIPVTQEDE